MATWRGIAGVLGGTVVPWFNAPLNSNREVYGLNYRTDRGECATLTPKRLFPGDAIGITVTIKRDHGVETEEVDRQELLWCYLERVDPESGLVSFINGEGDRLQVTRNGVTIVKKE